MLNGFVPFFCEKIAGVGEEAAGFGDLAEKGATRLRTLKGQREAYTYRLRSLLTVILSTCHVFELRTL